MEAGKIDTGASERTTSPTSRRRTPRCADAGRTDREADERVHLPALCPLWCALKAEPSAGRTPTESTVRPTSTSVDERVLILPCPPPTGDHPDMSAIPNCSGIKKPNPALGGRRPNRP